MEPPLRITLSLLFAVAVTSWQQAHGLDDAAIERASTETLLSMPEPPLGYSVTKHPLIKGEQLLGFQFQVKREDAVSKVLIQIESRDLSGRASRVAACKGYVNGLASALRNAGFKITAHKAPDLEEWDFQNPVVVDLTFANDEGKNLLVNKRTFFTTKGFDVTVVATDDKELKVLTDWAAQIRPASLRPQP